MWRMESIGGFLFPDQHDGVEGGEVVFRGLYSADAGVSGNWFEIKQS